MRARGWFAGFSGLISMLVPAGPDAACGFYAPPANAPPDVLLINDADQVAIMREGTRFALTMATNYRGPAEDFAMVVPVPVVLHEDDVRTLDPEIFAQLDRATAPRVQEYWEADPCPVPVDLEAAGNQSGGSGTKHKGGEGMAAGGGAPAVTVEAQFIQGEYEIVVLGATDSDALEKWLVDHAYRIPKGASAALAPYVAAQQKFVVAKVDAKKVKRDASGAVVLSPLRFVYETPDMRLPVRLGLLNAPTEPGKKQDLIVFVLARKRVEAANYANAFMPTNVDIDQRALDVFPSFYAALFDAVLEKAGRRAVTTETAWSASGIGLPSKVVAVLGGDAMLGMTGHAVTPPDLQLTRLHTRYDGATLSEDIVFRQADPVAGGREEDGAVTNASPSQGQNAFQTRFAVRHAWPDDIECEHPRRGIWGPPPPRESPRGITAVDTAAAPRNVAYATYVKSELGALGVKGPKFGAAPPIVRPSIGRKLSRWWEEWAGYVIAAAGVTLGLGIARYRRQRAPA